jgi:hypothetical protein
MIHHVCMHNIIREFCYLCLNFWDKKVEICSRIKIKEMMDSDDARKVPPVSYVLAVNFMFFNAKIKKVIEKWVSLISVWVLYKGFNSKKLFYKKIKYWLNLILYACVQSYGRNILKNLYNKMRMILLFVGVQSSNLRSCICYYALSLSTELS